MDTSRLLSILLAATITLSWVPSSNSAPGERFQKGGEKRLKRDQDSARQTPLNNSERRLNEPASRTVRDDRDRESRRQHDRDWNRGRYTHYHHHRVGVRVNVLPPRHVTVHVSGHRYYYYGGVYYRPYGSTYVIVAAPINAQIAALPYGYVTFSLGPKRYFYVNGTYYVYDMSHQHYVVVKEPAGGAKAAAQAQSSAPSQDLLIYPNNNQDQVTQNRDRYECHVWAMKQSEFDPTRIEPQPESERQKYRRAITLCLEARAYSVG